VRKRIPLAEAEYRGDKEHHEGFVEIRLSPAYAYALAKQLRWLKTYSDTRPLYRAVAGALRAMPLPIRYRGRLIS